MLTHTQPIAPCPPLFAYRCAAACIAMVLCHAGARSARLSGRRSIIPSRPSKKKIKNGFAKQDHDQACRNGRIGTRTALAAPATGSGAVPASGGPPNQGFLPDLRSRRSSGSRDQEEVSRGPRRRLRLDLRRKQDSRSGEVISASGEDRDA